MSPTSPLSRLAELLNQRNAIDAEIATLIDRPALTGHMGEFIAARIFGIELEASAVQKGHDGRFLEGPLAGKTVNIKWYGKLESLLDLHPMDGPDYYLVLAGPKATSLTSRGGHRPLVIASAFLFEAGPLLARLRQRGVKIGIATSVAQEYWHEAEVYPEPRHEHLRLNEEQREMLARFRLEMNEGAALEVFK